MATWFHILGWVLSIATVVGNGFVVGLLAHTPRLHSTSNWFVLSLAVADFGVGIIVYPFSFFCYRSMQCNLKVYVAFFWFFLHSSATNLCALTWNRYFAIVHPFKYHMSMTERRPGIVIMTAWLVSFASALSLLVGLYATQSPTVLKILRIANISIFDIVSCALLLYSVIRILIVARTQAQQVSAGSELHGRPSTEVEPSRRGNQRNTALFIIALVVFFLGCYVIVSAVTLCLTFSSCQTSNTAGQAIVCLLTVNSAVNPLVYAFLKRDIKREAQRLFCREHFNEDLTRQVLTVRTSTAF
ncbi:octopamine receptor beta-2R-like [Stylophora pistillata]|uniref:octopamine receptor beta-2R-like n=1 Tax=Stylophora pistillata TaxID=50429 RepID=UPI000C0572CB|nr:octopamine receptor beta-2R-like [Stylophora pistillata]